MVRFVVRVVCLVCLCVPGSVSRVSGSRIGWIEFDTSLPVTVSRGPAAVTAADPARAPARARGLGVGRTGRCGRSMAHGQDLERRKRAAIERYGQGGAAGSSYLGALEAGRRETRQLRAARQSAFNVVLSSRRRHEGGDALVAKRIVREVKAVDRNQLAHGWREGHHSCVADVSRSEKEVLEPRQRASGQGGGEQLGASVV